MFSLRDRHRGQRDHCGLEPGSRRHFVPRAGRVDYPGGRRDRQVSGKLGQIDCDYPVRHTCDRTQSWRTRCWGERRSLQPWEIWASNR